MNQAFRPTAEIALEDNQLVLQFEGHSITIPFTLKGLAIIKAVLSHRADAQKRTIATHGAPTQHMIREWLRRLPAPEKKKKKKKLTLEDLGL